MYFFEMFSGIGGFRAGVRELGWKCGGWAEIDGFARRTYAAIFPESSEEWNATDITQVSEEDMDGIGQIDMLMGGSPCQSFSLAGSRKGFDDVRGTLFFEFARFAKCLQPSWLIFENVDGLLSHDRGRTFEIILRTLNEIGYVVDFHVYNATEFDVPQNRNRIFLVGKRRDVPFQEGRGTARRSPVEWKIRERLCPSLFEDGIDFFWFPFPTGPGLTRRLVNLLEMEVDEKYFLRPETEAKVRLKLKERQEKRSGSLCELTEDVGDAFCVDDDEGGCGATTGLYTVLQKTHSATMTVHDNETGTLQSARLDKVPMVNVPVVRHDDGQTVEYAERVVANAIDANHAKGLDNHGQRTGVAVIANDALGTIKEAEIASTVRANAKGNMGMVYARSIMVQDRHEVEVAVKSGLMQSRGFETREDGVSHCIKGEGGGSSKNFVELESIVRSARFRGRESGLELEERDDGVAHCLSSASGGASKGFVTLDIARTVRATRGRSYDDKHSQTLVPVPQFIDRVTDEDQNEVMIAQRARGYNEGGLHKIAPTIGSCSYHNNNHLIAETRIRRLTPREVWRLMGREDWEFDRARGAGISDSQLYKQAGNALIPSIVTAIAKEIAYSNK